MSTINGPSARFLLLFFATAFLIGGCATQDQPAVAAGKDSAWLEATAPIWVCSLDGKKVSQIGFTGQKRFAITPGPHIVQVRYSDFESHRVMYQAELYRVSSREMSEHPVPVKFQAEAGHVYYVHAGAEISFWHPHVDEVRDPVFQEVKAQ